MKKEKILVGFLLIFFFCVSVMAAEKVSIVGKKQHFYNNNGELSQIGVVTFMGMADKEVSRHSGFRSRLYILGTGRLRKGPIRIYGREFKNNGWSIKSFWHGYTSRYGKPTIDGRDHSLNGNLLKSSSDKIPGIETNTKAVRVRHVAVIPRKPKFNKDLDITKLVEYLKKDADVVITKDTECDEDGCVFSDGGENAGYSLGTKKNPKIVVVDKARLVLKEDFKGYGVLILTGERKNVPQLGFADEIKKEKCKITGKTLTDLFKETKKRFRWNFLSRVRKSLRLTMNDNAAWYGVVISDVSYSMMVLGRQTYYYRSIIPIRKPLKPFSFLNFIGSAAYAKNLDEEETGFSWGKKKSDSKPARKLKLQIGRVKIYGAVLLKSRYATIRMNSADILYCSQAISLVDNMISSLPFVWEEYKEEK